VGGVGWVGGEGGGADSKGLAAGSGASTMASSTSLGGQRADLRRAWLHRGGASPTSPHSLLSDASAPEGTPPACL